MSVNYSRPLTYVEIDVSFCRYKDGFGNNTQAGNWDMWLPYTLGNINDSSTEVIEHSYRFNVPSPYANAASYSYASILDISETPAQTNMGISIGSRLNGSITFKNHPSSDSDIDSRAHQRTYADGSNDPFSQGTFWGKLVARQPFLRGMPLRIMRGYEGQPLTDYVTQHLLVDGISSDPNGDTVTIQYVDIFRFLDDDQAKAPAVSIGVLDSDITDSASTFDVQTGAGATYPASGYVLIGKEVMSFTRSGDTFTVTRAQYNTEAKEHKSGDTVQLCLHYAPQTVADIIHDLLDDYTDISSAWLLDKNLWDQEMIDYSLFNYGGLVVKPTPVKTLINELIQQCGLAVWCDSIAQRVKLEVIKPVSPTAKTFTDNDYLSGSFKTKAQDQKLITEMVTWYNQINPVENLSDSKNYAKALLSVGEVTAAPTSIKKELHSRWIPQNAPDTAKNTNRVILERYQIPPRVFSFSLVETANTTSLTYNQGIYLRSHKLTDTYGNPVSVPARITSLSKDSGIISVVAEEMLLTVDPQFDSVRTFTINENITNGLNLRELHDTLKSTEPQSGDEYVFIVEDGVYVGGLTSEAGCVTGEWPAGVTLTLINHGKIYGHGGYRTSSVPFHTIHGASAGLKATVNITIDNQGTIAGGGDQGSSGIWTDGDGIVRSQWGGAGAGFPAANGLNLSQSSGFDDGVTNGSFEDGQNPADHGFTGSTAVSGNGLGDAPSIEGDGYITWTATGTRIGSIMG